MVPGGQPSRVFGEVSFTGKGYVDGAGDDLISQASGNSPAASATGLFYFLGSAKSAQPEG